MNHIKNTGLFLLLALSVLSCKEESETREIEPVEVRVAMIGEDSINSQLQSISYSGTIRADKTVNLTFQVSGTVEQVPVNSGEYVEKGRLIAEIDETTYRNQYNAQNAQLQLAKENYERINEVYQKGSIAEIKMLEARSNYEQARSATQALYQNIKHTQLFAPISGYLGEIMVEAGDVANPAQPIARLMNIEVVKALLSVPDAEISNFDTGDQAVVIIDALGPEQFEGIVEEVAVASSAGSPVHTVTVNIQNPEGRIRPGMAASIRFPNKTGEPRAKQPIVIPERSINVTENGTRFVYLVDPQRNVAVQQQVETGKLMDNGIQVDSGLEEGDLLVTSGYHKLTNNTPVTILE